ncbi:radical SAM protein [Proteiniphilum sp. UBA5384]|uniref:radical SAM protein n=1 Tax=Proteiniphilum sp. UBA5384 TaxID=1947279 RepID=UPI0025F57538|nr:radical SAM protein [Proteiniphilum sp. UBA5384]
MEEIILYEKEKRCTCTLYMTESCNLNCTYCYERKKGVLNMSLDVAKEGIISTFQRAVEKKVHYVEILFHGGEPFIAFDRIREICEWVWSRQWPVKYICYATTNGTLIHGEIKEWLMRHKDRFVLGLSLDGTREMHNRNRSNSYDRIDIEFFKDMWPEQGVKMTPSPGTLSSLAEGIIHIHQLGFKRNNCSFATGIDWTVDELGNSISYREELQHQLMKLALFYLNNPDIDPVDTIQIRFTAIAAGIDRLVDKLCGAGSIMRCWTPDGQCLPCHLFYEASKEKKEKIPFINFSSRLKISDPQCKGCILEPVCPTCYGGNYITYGDIAKRDPFTCEITKIRASAASWMMGQMLEEPYRYVCLKNMTEDELAMTVKGVLMVQEMIKS